MLHIVIHVDFLTKLNIFSKLLILYILKQKLILSKPKQECLEMVNWMLKLLRRKAVKLFIREKKEMVLHLKKTFNC